MPDLLSLRAEDRGAVRGGKTWVAAAAAVVLVAAAVWFVVRDGDELAGMLHLDVEWSELGGAVGSPVATFTAPI
jgi:hypothetical protein